MATTTTYIQPFIKRSVEPLEIIDITDTKGREYIINEKNAFMVDLLTIYLPNVKEGDVVYVRYKCLPPKLDWYYVNTQQDTEFPLPNQLLRLLYALVTLKVVRAIDGFKQVEGQILQNYVRELEEAKRNQWSLTPEMETTLELKKGFY